MTVKIFLNHVLEVTAGMCMHTAMCYCSRLIDWCRSTTWFLAVSVSCICVFTTGLIEALPAEVIAKLLPQSTPALARLHSMLGIDTITVPKFLAAYVIPNYVRLPDMAQAQLLTYVMETW